MLSIKVSMNLQKVQYVDGFNQIQNRLHVQYSRGGDYEVTRLSASSALYNL